MKKYSSFILSSSLSFLLLLSGCGVSNFDNQIIEPVISEVQANSINQKTINIELDNPALFGKNIVIETGFSSQASNTEIAKNQSNKVSVNTKIPQLISVLNKDKSQVMAYSIVSEPLKTNSSKVNALSTAASMVFLNPFIASTDKAVAGERLELIQKRASTQKLARLIENEWKNGRGIESKSVSSALEEAYKDALNLIGEKIEEEDTINNPNIVEGIELNQISSNKLKINNYKKRNADLYFYQANKKAIEYESIPAAFPIKIDKLKLKIEPFKKDSQINQLKQLNSVEVLGLGLKDLDKFRDSWSGLSKENKVKYSTPILKSFVFDFINPILSIVIGFNLNNALEVHINQLISDMPAYTIIEEFTSKNYGNALRIVGQSMIKSLLANKAYLLRKIIKNAGLSLSDGLIGKVKSLGGIIDIIKNSVELVRAIQAYRNTSIKGVFDVKEENGRYYFKASELPVDFD